MAGTPAPVRRTPLAIALFVLISGTLAFAVPTASATPAQIRLYSPTLTANTSCVAPGSVNRFTATITNSSSSNQVLGSALFHSNRANGFTNISFRSFTRPVASGGKTWQALPDLVDADGVYLRAAGASQALASGQSVSFTFQAKAPSSLGNKTWVTDAWQSTVFVSGRFTLDTGASNPVVNVDTSCPATFPNGGTVTAPPGTSLQVVPNDTINCDAPFDGTFPGFAGTVQIIPSPYSEGPILVTFDDPNGAAHEGAPFCKGMSEGPPVILTLANDSCDSTDGQPPCIENQFVDEGGHLVTTLKIDANDPPVRH